MPLPQKSKLSWQLRISCRKLQLSRRENRG